MISITTLTKCLIIGSVLVASCSPGPDDRRAAAKTGAETATPELRYTGSDSLVVYKSPTCGCCKNWVEHMQKAGFRVVVHDTEDLAPIKSRYGVAQDLSSCHTALIGRYVVEGHVPAADVQRLLRERPDVVGLAVPGMPAGSPGMEGPGAAQSYHVVAFDRTGMRNTFANH